MDTCVILKADPFTMFVNVYLGYRQGNSWMNITLDNPGEESPVNAWPTMRTTEVPAGTTMPPDPFVRLPLSCLPSLREEMAKLGITSETDEHRAGELKATKAHLEDMRKLVFRSPSKGATVGR